MGYKTPTPHPRTPHGNCRVVLHDKEGIKINNFLPNNVIQIYLLINWTILDRALTNWRFAVLNSHFWCWDSYFLKEAIFFCIVGLPLFGKEGSGTPVFKILVRALLDQNRSVPNLIVKTIGMSMKWYTFFVSPDPYTDLFIYIICAAVTLDY